MCLWKKATSSVLNRQKKLFPQALERTDSQRCMMEASVMAEVMMAMTPGLTMGIREEFACLACL